MAKRQAGNQLNHDNWDEEEDQETAGVFKKVFMLKMLHRSWIFKCVAVAVTVVVLSDSLFYLVVKQYVLTFIPLM